MEARTNKELVIKARELYRQAQSLQKEILDMFMWELIELDEEEEQLRIREEWKTQ
jgi:hypothetical protein